MIDGFERATRDAGIIVYGIATALRHHSDSVDVAMAASRYVGRGIVAFDLAGPEAGFPPDAHLEACRIAKRGGLGLTLHAGEVDGAHSMWRALALCGAQRLGHGVHIVDDTHSEGGILVDLGPFAKRVRDHQIPLELSVTSNIRTGSWASPYAHPFGALFRAGFNVSINTDNRLISGITMNDEYALASETFDISTAELMEITIGAIRAGFGEWNARRTLIDQISATPDT